MPLYEYSCHTCHRDVELLIRGDEKPECPECGGHDLEKLLSVPAAHVAGQMQLPVCQPRPTGGCGAPRCGMGACGMED